MSMGTTVWASWVTYEYRRAKSEDPWSDPVVTQGSNALRLTGTDTVKDVLARRGITQMGSPTHRRDVHVLRQDTLP